MHIDRERARVGGVGEGGGELERDPDKRRGRREGG